MGNSVSGEKIASSFLWILVEKFGYSGISLFSTIFLARLLSPYDFGLVGSVTVITSLSNMIVESGMGAALVNKKNTTERDYNTVFTFNLLVSGILYTLIFFIAPYIADYFKESILKDVIRILSLTLIFNAFTIVQRTILIKKLYFKKQSIIAILSLIISVILSVMAAFNSWGVWAIVIQLTSYSLIYSIAIIFTIRHIPKLEFSYSSFKDLLGFGGRIILSSAIQVGYNDIISSIIARIYSIQVTGLYTQSQKLISFPINIFRSLFDIGAFPILSKVSESEFASMCSKINRAVYLLAFPFLLVIPFNTKEIIKVVLGDQWLEANRIFALLSIGVLILLIEIATFNVLKSSGNAKPYLRVGIYRTAIGLSILIATHSFSIDLLLLGTILTNLATSMIAINKVSKLTMYKIKHQLKDIIFPLLIGLTANIFSYFILKIIKVDQDATRLSIYGIIVLSVSIILCQILRVRELGLITQKIKQRQ